MKKYYNNQNKKEKMKKKEKKLKKKELKLPLKKRCYIEVLLITLFSNVEKNYKLLSEILNIIKNSMKTELDKEPKFKHNLIKKKNI